MTNAPGSPVGRPGAGALAAQLLVQAAALLGQEAALAKAEVKATARRASTNGILLGAAAGAAVSAWGVFLAAAILGISVGLPAWAAALIIGGALAAVAGLLALVAGRRLARVPWGMPMTAQSIREDLDELRRAATPPGAWPSGQVRAASVNGTATRVRPGGEPR